MVQCISSYNLILLNFPMFFIVFQSGTFEFSKWKRRFPNRFEKFPKFPNYTSKSFQSFPNWISKLSPKDFFLKWTWRPQKFPNKFSKKFLFLMLVKSFFSFVAKENLSAAISYQMDQSAGWYIDYCKDKLIAIYW